MNVHLVLLAVLLAICGSARAAPSELQTELQVKMQARTSPSSESSPLNGRHPKRDFRQTRKDRLEIHRRGAEELSSSAVEETFGNIAKLVSESDTPNGLVNEPLKESTPTVSSASKPLPQSLLRKADSIKARGKGPVKFDLDENFVVDEGSTPKSLSERRNLELAQINTNQFVFDKAAVENQVLDNAFSHLFKDMQDTSAEAARTLFFAGLIHMAEQAVEKRKQLEREYEDLFKLKHVLQYGRPPNETPPVLKFIVFTTVASLVIGSLNTFISWDNAQLAKNTFHAPPEPVTAPEDEWARDSDGNLIDKSEPDDEDSDDADLKKRSLAKRSMEREQGSQVETVGKGEDCDQRAHRIARRGWKTTVAAVTVGGILGMFFTPSFLGFFHNKQKEEEEARKKLYYIQALQDQARARGLQVVQGQQASSMSTFNPTAGPGAAAAGGGGGGLLSQYRPPVSSSNGLLAQYTDSTSSTTAAGGGGGLLGSMDASSLGGGLGAGLSGGSQGTAAGAGANGGGLYTNGAMVQKRSLDTDSADTVAKRSPSPSSPVHSDAHPHQLEKRFSFSRMRLFNIMMLASLPIMLLPVIRSAKEQRKMLTNPDEAHQMETLGGTTSNIYGAVGVPGMKPGDLAVPYETIANGMTRATANAESVAAGTADAAHSGNLANPSGIITAISDTSGKTLQGTAGIDDPSGIMQGSTMNGMATPPAFTAAGTGSTNPWQTASMTPWLAGAHPTMGNPGMPSVAKRSMPEEPGACASKKSLFKRASNNFRLATVGLLGGIIGGFSFLVSMPYVEKKRLTELKTTQKDIEKQMEASGIPIDRAAAEAQAQKMVDRDKALGLTGKGKGGDDTATTTPTSSTVTPAGGATQPVSYMQPATLGTYGIPGMYAHGLLGQPASSGGAEVSSLTGVGAGTGAYPGIGMPLGLMPQAVMPYAQGTGPQPQLYGASLYAPMTPNSMPLAKRGLRFDRERDGETSEEPQPHVLAKRMSGMDIGGVAMIAGGVMADFLLMWRHSKMDVPLYTPNNNAKGRRPQPLVVPLEGPGSVKYAIDQGILNEDGSVKTSTSNYKLRSPSEMFGQPPVMPNAASAMTPMPAFVYGNPVYGQTGAAGIAPLAVPAGANQNGFVASSPPVFGDFSGGLAGAPLRGATSSVKGGQESGRDNLMASSSPDLPSVPGTKRKRSLPDDDEISDKPLTGGSQPHEQHSLRKRQLPVIEEVAPAAGGLLSRLMASRFMTSVTGLFSKEAGSLGGAAESTALKGAGTKLATSEAGELGATKAAGATAGAGGGGLSTTAQVGLAGVGFVPMGIEAMGHSQPAVSGALSRGGTLATEGASSLARLQQQQPAAAKAIDFSASPSLTTNNLNLLGGTNTMTAGVSDRRLPGEAFNTMSPAETYQASQRWTGANVFSMSPGLTMPVVSSR